MLGMENVAWDIGGLIPAGLGAAGWYWERARRRLAERRAHTVDQAQAHTLRLLRLATGDQRDMALSLFGHAQTRQPEDPTLAGLARRLLDMSENLVAQTELPNAPRYLEEEALDLAPLLHFAVEQVSAHLGPARRVWRIDPALATTTLLADRRALHQVLVNVLASASASTRDGDWIEISLQTGPIGLEILVQDEGVGLPANADGQAHDGRGIGLRLTLARSLMQAHGGALAVESAERVGTCVRLVFPAGRILG
jgi:signal transduction histidine kinase